jgi:hypothetical protein
MPTVAQRFQALLENLKLTEDQVEDGKTKYKGITYRLNRAYYNSSSETDNAKLVGSWGKLTRVRPPRDIDLMFVLPYSVYERFQGRVGNKQSALLQEVKGVLQDGYPSTAIKGDGPVVSVPFATFKVEVVPAFLLNSGQYWICDTNNGGSYRRTAPDSESKHLDDSNARSKGNTKALVRMMKCWQYFCSVPIKSFHIELVAVDFLSTWLYFDKSETYYDWMVRDFLSFLISRKNCTYYAPGTLDAVPLGDGWVSRAESAQGRASKACDYERDKYPHLAGEEWQKIFGSYIPIS